MKLAEAFLVFGPEVSLVRQCLDTTFEGDRLHLDQTPALLEVYPTVYSQDISARLAVFALPDGLTLYRKSQTEDITHFVTTDNEGVLRYCSACRISEKPSKKKEVYYLKSLVLVSTAPFYTLHRALLEHFRELVSRDPQYRQYQEHMRFRVDYRELLLSALFSGLPPPVEETLVTHYPTQTLVGTRLNEERFVQYRSPRALQVANYPFHLLLQRLRPENIVDVLHCLLFELRVILVSSDESILAPIAEAMVSLLLPFRWKHIYVPYLPSSLVGYLDAPVPYLMGVKRGTAEISGEQVVVDLDRSRVEVPQELPAPPAPFGTQLFKTLVDITRMDNLKTEEAWTAAVLHTQRALLNYFLHVLSDYPSFLHPNRQFNSEGFLRQQDLFNHPFYDQLLKTQLWAQFIEGTCEETTLFTEKLRQFQESDYMVFRLDQAREVDVLLENYRRPLRIGLESLFNAFRPETTFPGQTKPISARPEHETAPVTPPSDRLKCGSYWYPLEPDLFLDFQSTPTAGEMRIKNLDTGAYESLRND